AHRAMAMGEPAIGRCDLKRNGAAQAGAALRVVHFRETWSGGIAGGVRLKGILRMRTSRGQGQPKGSANVQKPLAKVLSRPAPGTNPSAGGSKRVLGGSLCVHGYSQSSALRRW